MEAWPSLIVQPEVRSVPHVDDLLNGLDQAFALASQGDIVDAVVVPDHPGDLDDLSYGLILAGRVNGPEPDTGVVVES